MSSYYVRRMGHVLGQFSAADLKTRAQSGELQPDDEVSRDKERWIRAGDIGGLTFTTLVAVGEPVFVEDHSPVVEKAALSSDEPPFRRPRSLQRLAELYKVLGFLSIFAAGIGAFVTLTQLTSGDANASPVSNGLELVALLIGSGVTCLALSSAIHVFLDAAEDLRSIRHAITKRESI